MNKFFVLKNLYKAKVSYMKTHKTRTNSTFVAVVKTQREEIHTFRAQNPLA